MQDKAWPTGMSRYKEREIISYKWSQGFLDSLLPHEIAHLILRDFIGSSGNIPVWLEEGVAQREEESKRKEAVEIVKGLIAGGGYIPLRVLMRQDIRQEHDPQAARRFYAQAVTLVSYLIEARGNDKFREFLRQLRDGEDVEEALASVYRETVDNIDKLEEGWLEYYRGGG